MFPCSYCSPPVISSSQLAADEAGLRCVGEKRRSQHHWRPRHGSSSSSFSLAIFVCVAGLMFAADYVGRCLCMPDAPPSPQSSSCFSGIAPLPSTSSFLSSFSFAESSSYWMVTFATATATASSTSSTRRPPLIRPVNGTLRFAMPIEISLPFDAGYVFAGIAAAFRQHNVLLERGDAERQTPNVDYSLEVWPLHHSIYNLIPEPFTAAFVVTSDPDYYFGFIGSRVFSDYFLGAFGEQLQLPSVGNQPILSPLPFIKTQIAMRAGSISEMSQLVNFAFHSARTLCAKSAVFALADGADQGAEILMQTGAPSPYRVSRADIGADVDYAGIFQVLGDKDVNCIFIADVESVTYALVGAFRQVLAFDLERWNNLHFFVGSGGAKAEYSAADRLSFENLYAAQVTPDPLDPTLVLSAEFREAMADPFVKNFTEEQLIHASVPRGYEPNFVSYEGYIAARLALFALSNTANVTRKSFIDSIYRSRFALFGGYSAGPFTRGACAVGADFTCNCNVGLKRIFMSRVNGQTGQHEIQQDDVASGEVDVSALSIPLEVCEDVQTTLRRSLRLVLVYPTNAEAAAILGHALPPASSSSAAAFSTAKYDELINLYHVVINATNRRAVANRQAYAVQLVPYPYDGTTDIESAVMPRLLTRYYPFAVMGVPMRSQKDALHPPTEAMPSGPNRIARFLPRAVQIADSDASFRGSDFDLLATVADHIHALVSFVTSSEQLVISRSPSVFVNGSYSGGAGLEVYGNGPTSTSTSPNTNGPFNSRPIHVIATTDGLSELARKSINTFQRSPASTRRIATATGGSSNLLNSIENAINAVTGTRLLTAAEALGVSSDVPTLSGAQMAALPTASSSASSAVTAPVILFVSNDADVTTTLVKEIVPRLPKNLLLLIAADEAHITGGYTADPPRNINTDVLFASAFGAWWSGSSSLAQSAAIVKASSSLLVNSTVSSSAIDISSSSSSSSAQPQQRRVMGALLKPQAVIDTLVAVATRAVNVSMSFPDSAHSAGTISLDGFGGMTLGQFSGVSCDNTTIITNTTEVFAARSPTRRCDCSKGARRISVLSLKDWSRNVPATLTTSATNLYTLDMSATCGVSYIPLAAAPSDSLSAGTIAIIAGLSAVGGILLLIGLGLLLTALFWKRNGRSHKHAPKNSDQPFAIVFTDIQSSTVLWAHASNVMSAAVDLHNQVMRDCIDDTSGYEVKTVGDSFMVAFKEASDAVRFAIKAQRALFAAEWSSEIDASYIELERVTMENQRRVSLVGAGGTAMISEGGAGDTSTQYTATDNGQQPSQQQQQQQQQHVVSAAGGIVVGAGTVGEGLGRTKSMRSLSQAGDNKDAPLVPLTAGGGNNNSFSGGAGAGAAMMYSPPMGPASHCNNNTNNTTNGDVEMVARPPLLQQSLLHPRGGVALSEDAPFTRADAPGHVWNGIRVRMGIHYGFGECKLDPVVMAYDYYGTIVNTAARVEGIGHGGMILATRAVIEALAEAKGGSNYATTAAGLTQLNKSFLRSKVGSTVGGTNNVNTSCVASGPEMLENTLSGKSSPSPIGPNTPPPPHGEGAEGGLSLPCSAGKNDAADHGGSSNLNATMDDEVVQISPARSPAAAPLGGVIAAAGAGGAHRHLSTLDGIPEEMSYGELSPRLAATAGAVAVVPNGRGNGGVVHIHTQSPMQSTLLGATFAGSAAAAAADDHPLSFLHNNNTHSNNGGGGRVVSSNNMSPVAFFNSSKSDPYDPMTNTNAIGGNNGGFVGPSSSVANNAPPPPSHPTDDAGNAVLSDFKAHFVSLGAKPLRGLPNGIEICHIILDEFASRIYPPLRLDRDGGMDDIDDGDATNQNKSDDAEGSIDSYVMGSCSSDTTGADGTAVGSGGSTATGAAATIRNLKRKSSIAALISVKPPSDATQVSEAPNNNNSNTNTNAAGGGGGLTIAERHSRAMNKINGHYYGYNGALSGQYAATNEVERYAEKTARVAKVASLTDFMMQFRMVRAVFSQVQPSQVRDLLEHVAKRWHVMLPKLAKMKRIKCEKERIDNYIMAHLVVKLSKTLYAGFAKTTAKGGGGGGGAHHNTTNTNANNGAAGMGGRRTSNMSCYSAVDMLVQHSNYQQNVAHGGGGGGSGQHHQHAINASHYHHPLGVGHGLFVGAGTLSNSGGHMMPGVGGGGGISPRVDVQLTSVSGSSAGGGGGGGVGGVSFTHRGGGRLGSVQSNSASIPSVAAKGGGVHRAAGRPQGFAVAGEAASNTVGGLQFAPRRESKPLAVESQPNSFGGVGAAHPGMPQQRGGGGAAAFLGVGGGSLGAFPHSNLHGSASREELGPFSSSNIVAEGAKGAAAPPPEAAVAPPSPSAAAVTPNANAQLVVPGQPMRD